MDKFDPYNTFYYGTLLRQIHLSFTHYLDFFTKTNYDSRKESNFLVLVTFVSIDGRWDTGQLYWIYLKAYCKDL